MAAADGLILPNWNPLQTGVAFGTFVLNETTDYFAVLFRAPNTNAIERCFVNVSAISVGKNDVVPPIRELMVAEVPLTNLTT